MKDALKHFFLNLQHILILEINLHSGSCEE